MPFRVPHEPKAFVGAFPVNQVIELPDRAHQAAQQSGLDATEAERRKLLAELLVGLEV